MMNTQPVSAKYPLSPPPRKVSIRLRIYTYLNHYVQAGLFIFGVLMILFWVFELPSVLREVYEFSGKLETATGKVLGNKKTVWEQNETELSRLIALEI